MKNFIQTFFFLICVMLSGVEASAQTNVGGGIYSNTTWTKANSPYIVTDTVVVFPGVTLTIQPGVTVKFKDNQQLEIRQAQLIANGTSTDSITFTSNSSSPTAGIYSGIYLNGVGLTSKFNYCNFSYANIGINTISSYTTVPDTLVINNSYFNLNLIGVEFNEVLLTGQNPINISLIDSSIFKNNTNIGLDLITLSASRINNCHFSYNSTGLQDAGDNNTVKSCIFDFNQTGLDMSYTLVENCSIINNQTGINSNSENKIQNCNIDTNSVLGISANGDSVVNCNIKYNGEGILSTVSVITGNNIEYNTGANIKDNSFNANGFAVITGNTISYGNIGIDNTLGAFTITKNIIENNNLGINVNSHYSSVHCNKICNNTTYDLKYTASSNINASNNYWCTSDSASTEAVIYDGYDNISLGLVSFMPIDSTCYLNPTAVNEITNSEFSIFPNPNSGTFNIEFASAQSAQVKVMNIMGEIIYSEQINNLKQKEINLSASPGIYFLQIQSGKSSASRKIIIQPK